LKPFSVSFWSSSSRSVMPVICDCRWGCVYRRSEDVVELRPREFSSFRGLSETGIFSQSWFPDGYVYSGVAVYLEVILRHCTLGSLSVLCWSSTWWRTRQLARPNVQLVAGHIPKNRCPIHYRKVRHHHHKWARIEGPG
jgi:hypothetical protein